MKRTALVQHLVIAWMLVIGLFGWLPLVRSVFDGESYAWGTSYFGLQLSGAGLAGDVWYLTLKTGFACFVLFALLRRWRPVGAMFATAWSALLLADSLYVFIANPEGLWFHGDTLGIQLNLSLIAPIIVSAMLLPCAWLWWQAVAEGAGRPAPLQPRNVRRLGMLAALLPLQFVLLHFGVPHGVTDQAGVILTMVQWFALGWALGLKGGGEVAVPPAGLISEKARAALDRR